MATPYKFEGWLGHSPDCVAGKMEWGEFEPKVWQEGDVDIQVSHCGICGSDLHMLRSGWGETPYPCCVGHEIIGRVVRVGQNVQHLKLGDRVGVGAQALSCMHPDCPDCSTGLESYCANPENVTTYGGVYPGDIGKSYGGYADYHRTNAHFAVKIPDGLDSALAAPMMCGGVTVYSPLKQHGCGPGKKVGIVGVGGLGHFAVMFAKALGADEVVGISRKSSKRADVLGLGATKYIATDDDEDWVPKNKRSLDIIICTVSSEKMPLTSYLTLLKTHGTFVQVGAPDNGAFPPINVFTLLSNGIKLGGSSIGSPAEIKEMLELARDKKLVPIIQQRPLKDANQTILDMAEGKARYRYVLVNEKYK